jgi:hypothetical protein
MRAAFTQAAPGSSVEPAAAPGRREGVAIFLHASRGRFS